MESNMSPAFLEPGTVQAAARSLVIDTATAHVLPPSVTVITLEPQTTPFTPPAGQCTLGFYCPGVDPNSYVAGGQWLSGSQCLAVHSTMGAMEDGGGSGSGSDNDDDDGDPADTKKGVAAVASATPSIGYRSECYPDGYFDIFPTLRLSPESAADPEASAPPLLVSSYSALAYPGSACISGWTKACTTTLLLPSGEGIPSTKDGYGQVWCCPPGLWTCERGHGDLDASLDGGVVFSRRCVSILDDTDQFWMTWHQGGGSTGGGTSWWTAELNAPDDPADAAAVYQYAFPLALASPTTDADGSSVSTVGTTEFKTTVTASASSPDASTSTSLGGGPPPPPPASPGPSRGVIAGVAVGAAAAAVVLAALGLWLFRRYRRSRIAATEIVEVE